MLRGRNLREINEMIVQKKSSKKNQKVFFGGGAKKQVSSLEEETNKNCESLEETDHRHD